MIEHEFREITIRVKYYPNGIVPNPSMVCDFCGQHLQRSIEGAKIHHLLCKKCRELFNKKIMTSMSVLDQARTSILNKQTERRGF